ncbi:MAG: Arm DNA-binding domain-containing protein, partial [Ilumatobacteraceae bacterium]
MANGSVYRREERKKPWIAHISWQEGDRRRQSKKSYATKREAQEALAEAIDSHRRQEFVAPTAIRVRDFFVTWIDTLETQGRKVSTIEGYRRHRDGTQVTRQERRRTGHEPSRHDSRA